ncbi:uncharacterized protein LOC121357303 isoform X2 [Pyrgilauda ruficollis]|uniref:uncharacterized protein LOC121357303 isoform X2 n=1 Tax=Pyrgilauda ruficollis TaxID=221976 RepID=UPI001B85D540|nr:uncharacterized protein LOC121357303 isoform X2 [Pyrgilauda ruficollis]
MARPRPRSLRARPPWRLWRSVGGNSRVFAEGISAWSPAQPSSSSCSDAVQQLIRTQHSCVWITGISSTGLHKIKMKPLLLQQQPRSFNSETGCCMTQLMFPKLLTAPPQPLQHPDADNYHYMHFLSCPSLKKLGKEPRGPEWMLNFCHISRASCTRHLPLTREGRLKPLMTG